MSANVDVLAVIERELRWFTTRERQASLLATRNAVAELLAALTKAEEFVDRHSEDWYTSGQSLLTEIRAALARCGGAQ